MTMGEILRRLGWIEHEPDKEKTPSLAEDFLDQAQRQAEWNIIRAHMATERTKRQMPSWEDLYLKTGQR